jgi:hypothetical protein
MGVPDYLAVNGGALDQVWETGVGCFYFNGSLGVRFLEVMSIKEFVSPK